MIEPYFTPEPDLDRMLCGRTRAVFGDIRQIERDTSNGDAFRRYVLKYIEEAENKMPMYGTEG